MAKTISQNMERMSPLPQRAPTTSAKGLRKDMSPSPPNETLIRTNSESLRRDFERNSTGPVVAIG